jgi:hypothetical protein
MPAGWQLAVDAAVPTMNIGDLDGALSTAASDDALLWLGRPEVGARWYAVLAAQKPDVTFWLAGQAGIDIFAAHSASAASGDAPAGDNDDRSPAHWLYWTDSHYNLWSQSSDPAIAPNEAARYRTYRATCAALSELGAGQTAATTAWELQERPITSPEIH